MQSAQNIEPGFLRLNQVLEIIPVGKSSFWAGVRTGKYPKGLKLGPRTTVWRREDIYRFIATAGEQAEKSPRPEPREPSLEAT